MSDVAIQINGVSMIFNPAMTPALDNITANIHRSGITGLVGPDGAGKTTLIRLMTGLMAPTKGAIITAPGFSQTLGYMPQKFGFYEDLTVLENLNLYVQLRGVEKAERKSTFERMLHFTNLKKFQDRRVGQLSGGMKQKLGLACALVGHPQVLLLDEPSVGVDPISRRELWQMVQELIAQGIAVVWSTAYLDEAQQCQEVILLNEGKMLFAGKPQDLTDQVQGRVFKVEPGHENRRAQLTQLLQRQGIVDATIEGSSLRVLVAPNASVDFQLPSKPIEPRFEDAFMDILQGDYIRESVLAQQLPERPKGNTTAIEAHNLTKKYGDFTAVNDVSFTVQPGEIFGLLGPNGAGKTTIFKMLCGILTPTQGKIAIAGVDLQKYSAQAGSKIGYMAQKFSLYGHLSVKQNLAFFSGVYGLSGKKQIAKIQEMVDIFSLGPFLNENADELPLGFKQRLALSCALMHEPSVLFLDEPTSGVDPLTRREFWVHLDAMVKKGVTIMITTHFMDEAQSCDRIALIYAGKNIAMATPDQLKESVRSEKMPDPTLEDAFIELIERVDREQVNHNHENV